MSVMIREYLGYDQFSNGFSHNDAAHLKESLFEDKSVSPDSIMVDIEGIHAGPTRNFTRYMDSALKSSIKSWTHPYEKPLIMHHNEKDGKIIGRIKSVYHTDVKTRSGTGALIFTTNVPDKEGKEQIKDGRLLTVSIGIIGHDVRCSVCNHNIANHGPCEHERGQVYDGEICYWDIYDMEGKELSYVIVPSDVYAKNIRVYDPVSRKAAAITESLKSKKGVSALELTDEQIKKLQGDLKAYEEENKRLKKEIEDSKEERKDGKEQTPPTEDKKEEVLEKKLEDLQGVLDKVQKELADAQKDLQEEKALRESLESQSIERNAETKLALAENYALLRKLSGKAEISMQQIQERTQDSLIDAIKDLKEELGEDINTAMIRPVADPTITESIQVKGNKEAAAGNIDLEEGLQDLFNNVASKFSHK